MTSQLFVNGKVFTGRGEDDFATAFRITDGVFSWVGDQADVAAEPVDRPRRPRPWCPGSSTCTPIRRSCRPWSTR